MASLLGLVKEPERFYIPKGRERLAFMMPGKRGWDSGVLVVTNQRVLFNAAGDAKDWSRTWRYISTWYARGDALVLELTSGSPVLITLRPDDAVMHPRFVAAMLHHAKDL